MPWPEDMMWVCKHARRVVGHEKSVRMSTCKDGWIVQVLHACDAVDARHDGLHIFFVGLQENI